MRVLVVDDNAATRRVIVAILSRLGCRADVALDGAEGVDMYGHLDYDCVLMACQLPGMSGYDATRAIRVLESERDRALVVAISANPLPEDRQRALDAGMDDHMLMPILIDELATALRRGTTDPSSYALIAPIELAMITDIKLFEHVERFLRDMMEIDDDVTDIIKEFVEQGHTRLAEVNGAAARSDATTVKIAGHSLKGSLSYLGVGEITAMCRMLEKHGENDQLGEVPGLVEEILAALARIDSGRTQRDG